MDAVLLGCPPQSSHFRTDGFENASTGCGRRHSRQVTTRETGSSVNALHSRGTCPRKYFSSRDLLSTGRSSFTMNWRCWAVLMRSAVPIAGMNWSSFPGSVRSRRTARAVALRGRRAGGPPTARCVLTPELCRSGQPRVSDRSVDRSGVDLDASGEPTGRKALSGVWLALVRLAGRTPRRQSCVSGSEESVESLLNAELAQTAMRMLDHE
jgi:hypothetical protein